MIIQRGFEALKELGTEKVGLDSLIDRAYDLEQHWTDELAVGKTSVPAIMTENQTCIFYTDDGRDMETNLTEHAFSQLCQRAGVPASYLQKCYDSSRGDLAAKNFVSWAGAETEEKIQMRMRLFDGTLHAALTPQYHPFEHPEILEGVRNAVGADSRYEANEAYLSSDRIHIRFVDFNNPLRISNDKLYSGFTVSSSNIGNGAFSIKYFLYRFACKNGIVRIQNGGVLFRQTHLQEFLQNSSELFGAAIDQMHQLDLMAECQINKAMNHKLTQQELSFFLEKAKRELRLGQKGHDTAREMIGTIYDQTMWGMINSITELSKQYTLDTRLEMEQWAGNMLSAA